jgi:hypothetical protein
MEPFRESTASSASGAILALRECCPGCVQPIDSGGVSARALIACHSFFHQHKASGPLRSFYLRNSSSRGRSKHCRSSCCASACTPLRVAGVDVFDVRDGESISYWQSTSRAPARRGG